MARQVSGKRYARAIFELALANCQADKWAEDLHFVAQALTNPEFSVFLRHAEVTTEQKMKAIDSVLQDVHPLVRNLGALLVTRGVPEVTPDVYEGYVSLLDEYRGRQQVEVTTAVPLDDQELERVQRFVAGLINKEVVLAARVDESILGGIVIQIGDKLLDGSTRARLEALRGRIRAEVPV